MNHWYTIKAADVRGAADISIYEEIGGFGVTAKQFAEDLKALGDVSHINLRIHSPGGDVFEGIAIYNLLRNHPADMYGLYRWCCGFNGFGCRNGWRSCCYAGERHDDDP